MQVIFCVQVQVTIPINTRKVAYEAYAEKLIECLPMNRPMLSAACHPISKAFLDLLQVSQTQPDKALNHVIKPALDASRFDDLLSIMEKCGDNYVAKLAAKLSMFEPGVYNVYYMYLCGTA